MRRFDAKKQRRKERLNDKALEEFSRSEEQEHEATITVGNRQVTGVIRKTGPSSLEFIERLPAGTERKLIRIVMSPPDNFFQYASSKATEEGFELNPSSEGAITLDANTECTPPDGFDQAIEREGNDEQE